ncbi:YggS family pyridoxal phosphate-dependent enzyme [Paenalcaligenes niemegkensis]|uniref:YggS family pyridoxal phosphate-dependent enzyme n=1 Tax=Paenalcaligenes niemegkensis TaxID=2895469 RepID=UPI001EE7A470|nr:YggS family pyridoxal phosphate-dependent enzyme [Paenalcaligenes niemegkensis]MCQ9617632.1 YggS family pyridoxal phosphate-dependent enzyme [Paenalcaligenes niemegkensis]
MLQRLKSIQTRITAACERSQRDPAQVVLLPVSKTFNDEAVLQAKGLGFVRFGENRAADIQARVKALGDEGLQWVMIGYVQSNKAKEIARYAAEVQSLDRISLAEALDRRLQIEGRQLNVLIQIKTAAESAKSGLEPAELLPFLSALKPYHSLRPVGLMTMATQTTDETEIRRCFSLARRSLVSAQDAGMDMHRLSMGMSNDFELAIEEGSTEIRVGSALFGSR